MIKKYKNFIFCQNIYKAAQTLQYVIILLIFLDNNNIFEVFCDPSTLPQEIKEEINIAANTEQLNDNENNSTFWQSPLGQFIEKYPAPALVFDLACVCVGFGGLLYLYFFTK